MTKMKMSESCFVACQTTVSIVLDDLMNSQCPWGPLLSADCIQPSLPRGDERASLPPAHLKATLFIGLWASVKKRISFFKNGRSYKPLKVLSRQKNKGKIGRVLCVCVCVCVCVPVTCENISFFLVKIYLNNFRKADVLCDSVSWNCPVSVAWI